MLSIRFVTVKPPKTLMLAKKMAAAATTWIVRFDEVTCSRAPTTMIPEIALVTDISGVCSAWCTCPMT